MLVNRIGAAFRFTNPVPSDPKFKNRTFLQSNRRWVQTPLAAFRGVLLEKRNDNRHSICTADELHYVPVSNSDWNLALWRYLPSPKAPSRNHPLLLLSGVATNAIGYDLSSESSFARYMSAQGFDTWTLEVRGAGLSTHRANLDDNKYPKIMAGIDSALVEGKSSDSSLRSRPANNLVSSFESEIMNGNGPEILTKYDELRLTTKLMETFTKLSQKLSDLLNGGLLEAGQNTAIASQLKHLNLRFQTFIDEGQLLFPTQVLDLQERFTATLEEFQKQLDLIVKYDWDFDHYLEEDVPAAVRWST